MLTGILVDVGGDEMPPATTTHPLAKECLETWHIIGIAGAFVVLVQIVCTVICVLTMALRKQKKKQKQSM